MQAYTSKQPKISMYLRSDEQPTTPPCLRASLLLIMLYRWVNFETVTTDEKYGHSLIDAQCFEGKSTTRKSVILRSNTSTIPDSSRRAMVRIIHVWMGHPQPALPRLQLGTRILAMKQW